MRQYTILTLAALLLAACSSDDGQTSAGEERVPLLVTSSIQVEAIAASRAVNTAWENSDRIGLFITDHPTTTAYTVGATPCTNLPYTFDDGTNYETDGSIYRSFTGSTIIYLPSAPNTVDVYAYYPYTLLAVDATNIPISVESQTYQNRIDLMRATHTDRSKTANTARLLFSHRLTKLQFNLKRGTYKQSFEITSATLSINGQPYEAAYNLYSDELTIPAQALGNIAPVVMSSAATGYDKSLEAIVMPNGDGNTATDRTVTITVGGTSFSFVIGSETTFQPGYKYIYNVTINDLSIQVDTDLFTDEQW